MRKIINILIFLWCMLSTIYGETQLRKKSIKLPEIVANDTTFIYNMHKMTPLQESDTENNSLHVNVIYIYKISDNEFEIDLAERLPYYEEMEKSVGYIKYKDSYFILFGDLISDYMTLGKETELFQFFQPKPSSTLAIIDYTEWLFYYKDGQFYIRVF